MFSISNVYLGENQTEEKIKLKNTIKLLSQQ